MRLNEVNLSSWLSQAAIAERMMQEWVQDLERQGYVQTAPGHWEKRNEAGDIVATVDRG